ncbi:MAG: AbrB family transcriptional regulator [Magnetococcales bacterium]|nr:AbrB family transcriptional regulator [Magnetococcales bacterium]NGZ25760.1 AbrB family transcriptional regulator [Magnetococcales bacterium]
MNNTVTRKGQATIPKLVGDWLEMTPGGAVVFKMEADGHIALPKADADPPVSRFAALRGRAGPGLSTDEIMALIRGEGGR